MAKKILDPIEVDGSVTAINFIGSGAGLTNVAQTATLDGFSSTSGGAVTATDTVQTDPERLQAVDAGLVQRLQVLVGGVDVDLDAALSEDDE